jgi:FemAB-related protein (PEP-CTERM system-associated)
MAAVRETAQENITGILPLMLFAAPDRDIRLISLPYSDGAGIVADDPATGSRLLAAALNLATEQGAVHVELRRAGKACFQFPASDYADHWSHTAHSFKTGLLRPLPASPDELWSLLSGKVRNQVRKARKSDCTVKTGGTELLDDFYAVFSENMRDLGSPVHPPELFNSLLGRNLLKAWIVAVYLETLPVAAAMVFRHNGTLYNPWASSLRRYRSQCLNMLLYWAMLEFAVSSGCRWFDFGRSSPDAATCRFKCQWGATMQPLIWHVFSRRPFAWNPLAESLVDEEWKTLDLETSRRQGPAVRRWISL